MISLSIGFQNVMNRSIIKTPLFGFIYDIDVLMSRLAFQAGEI